MKDNSSYYFLINSLEWWWAERVVINFAKEYQAQLKQVYIVTLKDCIFYDLPDGVIYLPLSSISSNILMIILMPRYVYQFKCLQKNYHLTEWISLLEIANFVHIMAVRNAVISFRTHISFFVGIVWWLYRVGIKRLYPKAGKIIVNSKENKYDLAQYLKIHQDKIEVRYNPVDMKMIHHGAQQELDSDLLQKIAWKKVFITVGRLVWQKQHCVIISALKKLYDLWYTDRMYLVVWGWPEQTRLTMMADEMWLGQNCIFLWSQINVYKYLAIADIFVYASRVEWFPNVLAEARALWVSIITTDFVSGAKEVVLGEDTDMIWQSVSYPLRGQYGVIVDPDDAVNMLCYELKEIINLSL